MPDIQTEMQKILQAWEQPETTETTKETTVFKPTTNTSRATFEAVRDNPGLPPKEYIRILDAKGHKPSSTSSLLGQMVRQGVVWKDSSGFLRPNQDEYKPLKAAKKLHKKVKVDKTFKVKTPEPVVAPKGITSLVEERKGRDEVQHIMDTISLPDAKRLHKALNEYFGTP